MDKKTLDKFDELDKRFKEAKTLAEHQQIEVEWWAAAVGAYNEHIAGTITLADGSTHTIPTI